MRTNIVIDEKLVDRCRKVTGIKTKRDLVDSSVWIDFFRGNKSSQVSVLKLLIAAVSVFMMRSCYTPTATLSHFKHILVLKF